MKSNRKYMLFFIICSLLGYGQAVSLSLETNTKEYQVRAPFKLNIGLEITGNTLEQQTPLKLPDLSKFEILGNASESLSFIDTETGVLVRQTIYQLILEPKQAGKIKIGSALIQINGKIYKSEPFDILIKDNLRKNNENTLSKNVQLYLEVENQSDIYKYKPIKVFVKVRSKNFHNLRDIQHIQIPQNDAEFIRLKKQDIEIEEHPEEIATQTLGSFIIFPKNSGSFVISPVFAKLNQEKISSNSLKINIKPFPKTAPKSFHNAVGNFNLNVSAHQNQVKINEPIDVFVKLSGEGNLKYISLPKILKSKDYDFFKPKRTEKITATQNNIYGEVTEHYVLIPKKEGDINIPLEDFSFFDPKNNKYKSLNGQYSIKVINLNTSKEKKTIIKEFMDEAGHMLKKTDLLPVSEKKSDKDNKIYWMSISIGLFIILALIVIFLLVFRRKKTIPKKKEEAITTIAETEELLKNTLFINKDYYFRAMEIALKQNNFSLFFDYYEELYTDTQQQIKIKQNQTLHEFLENNFDEQFIEKFNSLHNKIQVEKYSPIHPNIKEIYDSICEFYSKIMK